MFDGARFERPPRDHPFRHVPVSLPMAERLHALALHVKPALLAFGAHDAFDPAPRAGIGAEAAC